MDWTALETCLQTLPDGVEVGVSAIAPDGEHWHHRGDDCFPAASTVKIPIMFEIYRLMEAGEMALGDTHVLTKAEQSPGSGVLQQLHTGLELSVADLLYLMMSISDNTATNILIDKAGMSNINATMLALGMHDSILGRPMRGRLAIKGEQENLATPNDYTRALQNIHTARSAPKAACAAMLETLALQQNKRRIGRHVPAQPGHRWGSKTGTNAGVVNDVGFVTTPGGTLLLAVYCRGVTDEVSGEAHIAELARCAMQVTGLLSN